MPRIHHEEKLSRCSEEPLAINVPVPLNRQIKELCERAEETGLPGEVTRKEMLSALLFSLTGPDGPAGEELVEMLRSYRTAEAGVRMPPDPEKRGFHDYEDRKPGRPRRR
jgi:hypothetical protein